MNLPDPKDLSTQELASAYAEHHDLLTWAGSFKWWASRRIADYIDEVGPIQTPYGIVEKEPKGFSYPGPEVLAVMPALIESATLKVEGKPTDIQRAQDLVSEEFGDSIQTSMDYKVDRTKAYRVSRTKGEAAEKLKEVMVPEYRLVVTK